MDGGFREWLAGLTRREMALVAVIAGGALAGAGLWYVRSLPQPVEVRAERRPLPAPTASATSVFVHVAGWVRQPGVYELPEGSRVIDALELAGGPKRGAELSALNLAAVLTDGQQVIVPRRAEAGTSGAAGAVPTAPGAAAGGLVNVNTATATELEELPGIGPVLAEAIVAYREEHGPFTSVDQLEDVSGIGPVTLEEIRDLVTV
ncbi:MAG TPA: ComEA family DNA-binding protein [Actinomycetota bacterium]|nr:ComEA family DNA-binding protein [Actinomycetota bacterium]